MLLIFKPFYVVSVVHQFLAVILQRTGVVCMDLDFTPKQEHLSKRHLDNIRSIHNQFNYGCINFICRKWIHIKLRECIVFRDRILMF